MRGKPPLNQCAQAQARGRCAHHPPRVRQKVLWRPNHAGGQRVSRAAPPGPGDGDDELGAHLAGGGGAAELLGLVDLDEDGAGGLTRRQVWRALRGFLVTLTTLCRGRFSHPDDVADDLPGCPPAFLPDAVLPHEVGDLREGAEVAAEAAVAINSGILQLTIQFILLDLLLSGEMKSD